MAEKDSLNNEFSRASVDAKTPMVMMIDGSGGMINVCKTRTRDSNPFVNSIRYAVEAYKSGVNITAYLFGDPDLHPPLSLDKIEDPWTCFTNASSDFGPTWEGFLEMRKSRNIGGPAHVLIVSDGEISDGESGTRKIIDSAVDFLKDNPESRFDVVVEGSENSHLIRTMKKIAAKVPENPPRVFVVDSVEKLDKSIATIFGQHTSHFAAVELAQVALNGTPDAVTTMPKLRFRKPPETV